MGKAGLSCGRAPTFSGLPNGDLTVSARKTGGFGAASRLQGWHVPDSNRIPSSPRLQNAAMRRGHDAAYELGSIIAQAARVRKMICAPVFDENRAKCCKIYNLGSHGLIISYSHCRKFAETNLFSENRLTNRADVSIMATG